MQGPKRVLVVMNMATVGRSSMAAVLPVLAACGVQGCPLPTALLSSHLGGFGEVVLHSTAPFGKQALDALLKQEVQFDAVYTGYLASEGEFAVAARALQSWPDAIKIVDPALGDGGTPYSKTTPGMIEAMRALAQQANVITPNATEAALLLGDDPAELQRQSPKALAKTMQRLARLSLEVVATSMPLGGGQTGIRYQGMLGTRAEFASKTVPTGYPGTGDLFAAALTGLLVGGADIEDAIRTAAFFVESAAAATYEAGGEVRHGVWFEPHLHLLQQ